MRAGSLSHSREAEGAGSVLQVAQQAQRAPQSLLPAGHPTVFPAASSGLATRMIPGLFELPTRQDLSIFPHERQQSTATLHEEHPPGATACGGNAISQPKHTSCHLQSKACRFHSSFTWLVPSCQGCHWPPNLCCVP